MKKINSKLFKILHSILFNCKLNDPSCPYVLFKKDNFKNIKDKLDYMREGFWWGFTACCLLKNFDLIEIDINHKKISKTFCSVSHKGK